MDTELGFLIGADKAVEQKTNQIKFTNFVAQAKSRNILTPISGCKIKSFNLGISEKFHKHHMNLNAYTELYQYLIKKKIINQKLGKASFWTWDYIQTINPDLIKTDTLHELIKKEDINFPTLLKCYNINYNELSDLLKNYKYQMMDDINAIRAGTKYKRKQKRFKTKKRYYK